ncbi:MAG TPA: transcriptional regulator [Nocardioides sp.]|nr:transcriptional regulator [Nocardioides sp.]
MPSTDPVHRIAALAEPTRRRLYDFVAGLRRPVGRDEAAEVVGVARNTAAFHLDRLVDEGLLQASHERLSGRTGPGAGRPAKLYRRTEEEIGVSLPARSYDLAGALLAAAVEESDRSGAPVRDALAVCARDAGRRIGDEAADGADLDTVLAGQGYEPYAESGELRLANCPFHDLAQRHTALVCGMNCDLIGGVLEGLGDADRRARLDPAAERCCVVVS